MPEAMNKCVPWYSVVCALQATPAAAQQPVTKHTPRTFQTFSKPKGMGTGGFYIELVPIKEEKDVKKEKKKEKAFCFRDADYESGPTPSQKKSVCTLTFFRFSPGKGRQTPRKCGTATPQPAQKPALDATRLAKRGPYHS